MQAHNAPSQSTAYLISFFQEFYAFLSRIQTGSYDAFRQSTNIMSLWGISLEFYFFAIVLLSVAVFHRHTLTAALAGLAIIIIYKFIFTGFPQGPGFAGLLAHLSHEWVLLVNLLGLLVGFSLLAHHFQNSQLPARLPLILPRGWLGNFALLTLIFIGSTFLDNIAGALIGATTAIALFRGQVSIAYLAAIVAAANAGGAGSVLGDTTTTMMWISGVPPIMVFEAFLPAAVTLILVGLPAAWIQQRYEPMMPSTAALQKLDHVRLWIVAGILIAVVATNVIVNSHFAKLAGSFPFLACAVWVVLIATTPLRRPAWSVVPGAFQGSLFLLALVLCASLMPVAELPKATWQSTFSLGFLSAVFDNIPLTALALKQGGYDWGHLAFTVGFGGSMLWFGSSAGVAVCNEFPQARSVFKWLKEAWFIIPAYIVAYFVLLLVLGWNPNGHGYHRLEPPQSHSPLSSPAD